MSAHRYSYSSRVNTSRVVHLVVGSRSDGERRDSPLAMIEHSIDVRWEHTLIGIIHLHCGVGPPKEGLWHIGTVVQTALDFQVGTARTQREACHSLLVEHFFHFAHPYTHATVGILLNASVNRHVGSGTVMLRPIELNAARDPRAGESHKGRLDDMVVIHKVATGNLVVGHLHAATQFGQHHHLDILVLQPDGQILFIHLLVRHGLNDGIGIDHTT